jgi:hypothetical protein
MSILDSFEKEHPDKYPTKSDQPKNVGDGLGQELERRRQRFVAEPNKKQESRDAYLQEHPEAKNNQSWQRTRDGKIVPFYDADVCVKNTTAIKNEIFQNIPRFKSLRSAALGLLINFIYHRNFPAKKDKHNTRKVWYHQKGLIVASRSLGTIAEDFGVARSTIQDWVAALEADGLIKVELEKRENVYIMGKIVDRTEVYFYAETATDSQL